MRRSSKLVLVLISSTMLFSGCASDNGEEELQQRYGSMDDCVEEWSDDECYYDRDRNFWMGPLFFYTAGRMMYYPRHGQQAMPAKPGMKFADPGYTSPTSSRLKHSISRSGFGGTASSRSVSS